MSNKYNNNRQSSICVAVEHFGICHPILFLEKYVRKMSGYFHFLSENEDVEVSMVNVSSIVA